MTSKLERKPQAEVQPEGEPAKPEAETKPELIEPQVLEETLIETSSEPKPKREPASRVEVATRK